MRHALLCCLIIFCLLHAAYAQLPGTPPSNLRHKYISTRADTVRLDTLSILSGSVQIKDVLPGQYILHAVEGYLVWKEKPAADSVLITYRVFPFAFSQPRFHKDPDLLNRGYVLTPYVYHGSNTTDKLIDFGGLTYDGSFGRGISFGNNQDVVLNSTLNLQLSGMLADSIHLLAAITDNNIPFQPEGNTQTLQDFDRVFIQFSRHQHQLVLGDFDLRQDQSHFMRFYKRLQGVSFTSAFPTGKKGRNTYGLSGAVTQGKFTRNIFQGEEGNQGPYRLQGANNEQFFIVVAGTEKVYVDGELLKRGQDLDYVIDYNTGEITFTPQRMITKDSRIQVTFEYSDRNYLNSQLYATDHWQVNERLQLHADIYSNQDAKNSPITQTLDAQQKRFLAGIGNDVSHAFYPSIAKDTFSTEKILYALVDSTVNGTSYDSVFVYSVSPDSARYVLGFSYVGQGNGNYVQAQNNANGRVYQWIAPQGGIPQGSYAPVILLVTPKKQQLFTVGADYKTGKNSLLQTELAFSNYDVNTFSRLQKKDDHGMAASVAYHDDHVLQSHAKYKLHLLSGISYEYTGKNFKPVEPYRNIEFNRDWSLPQGDTLQAEDEHLTSASVELNRSDIGNIRYGFSSYFRGNTYKGYRNTLGTAVNKNGFLVNGEFNITNSKTLTGKNVYLRPDLDIAKQIKKWNNLTVGSRFSMEQNEMRSLAGDSLSFQSFSFNTLEFYVKTSDEYLNKIGISVQLRTDQAPDTASAAFKKADRSQTINIFGELAKSRYQQLKWNITYRNLEVEDSALTGQQPDKTLLGRIEYNLNAGKGFITASTVYELGSGQEQKLAYTYIEVPAGQGQYTWIDYNKDGIPQVNEFEPAVFQDEATYVRILTPTNDYIKTNYVQFNQHLAISPKNLMKKTTLHGMALFLSRLNSQSSFQINRKEQARGLSQFDPFSMNIEDTALISVASLISNALFFNQLSATWGIDYTNTIANNKVLLTYGYDTRKTVSHVLHARWNFARQLTAEAESRYGSNSDWVPGLEGQSYAFVYSGITPKLTYTHRTTFRLSLSYAYDHKHNSEKYGDELAVSQALSTALKYNVLSSGTLNMRFTYNRISFNGEAGSTAGYNMLNGLLPGRNLLWDISLEKRLAGNLEMTLEYEGRKTASARMINTGRASIRAIF